MREYIVAENQDGKRADKWLMKALPALPMSMAQKFLRTRRVKRNGRPAKADERLEAGDRMELFIPDEFFQEVKREDAFLKNFRVRLNVLYEDENLLLADKRPGVAVHPDEHEKVDTLLNHIRAYLYQKGEYDSTREDAFAPALCNRIDRFTGGIVISAKNEAALKTVDAMIRGRRVEKRYLLIAKGVPRPEAGTYDNFLFKPEDVRKTQVLERPTPGAKRAVTQYRTLATKEGLSLVECRLITGRTHQIRAQFAHAGHPLLGDSQYGDRMLNERYHRQSQALYAYGLQFHPDASDAMVAYLAERVFRVPLVPFAREFFPETDVSKMSAAPFPPICMDGLDGQEDF